MKKKYFLKSTGERVKLLKNRTSGYVTIMPEDGLGIPCEKDRIHEYVNSENILKQIFKYLYGRIFERGNAFEVISIAMHISCALTAPMCINDKHKLIPVYVALLSLLLIIIANISYSIRLKIANKKNKSFIDFIHKSESNKHTLFKTLRPFIKMLLFKNVISILKMILQALITVILIKYSGIV